MNIPSPTADSASRPGPLDLLAPAGGAAPRDDGGAEPFESLLRPPAQPPPPARQPEAAPEAPQPPQADSAPSSRDDGNNSSDLEASSTAGEEEVAAEDTTSDKDDLDLDSTTGDETTQATEAAVALAAIAAVLTTPAAKQSQPNVVEAKAEATGKSQPKGKHTPGKGQPDLSAAVQDQDQTKTKPKEELPAASKTDAETPVKEVEETDLSIPSASAPVQADAPPQPAVAASDQPVVAPVQPAAEKQESVPAGQTETQSQSPASQQAAVALAAANSDEPPAAPARRQQQPTVATNDESENQPAVATADDSDRSATGLDLAKPDAPSPSPATSTQQPNPSFAATVAATAPRQSVELLGGSHQARSSEGPMPQVDSARILHRVARAFAAAQMGEGEIRLRLSPPELGAVRLEIRVQGNAIVAHLETETSAARTAILDNLPALRERLADQGVRIDRFDVDLMQRGSGGPADQPGNRQPQESQPRPNLPEPRRPQPAEGVVARRAAISSGDSRRLNVIV